MRSWFMIHIVHFPLNIYAKDLSWASLRSLLRDAFSSSILPEVWLNQVLLVANAFLSGDMLFEVQR